MRFVLLAALGLLPACSIPHGKPELPRWQIHYLVDSDVAYVFTPICATHRAPALGKVPPEGLSPTYLFDVTGASGTEMIRLITALRQNAFRVDNNYTSIDGTWTLQADGMGVLKTQDMADRLFRLMCALEFPHARLVHARYNSLAEQGRSL
jgi:hypothetical protein